MGIDFVFCKVFVCRIVHKPVVAIPQSDVVRDVVDPAAALGFSVEDADYSIATGFGLFLLVGHDVRGHDRRCYFDPRNFLGTRPSDFTEASRMRPVRPSVPPDY